MTLDHFLEMCDGIPLEEWMYYLPAHEFKKVVSQIRTEREFSQARLASVVELQAELAEEKRVSQGRLDEWNLALRMLGETREQLALREEVLAERNKELQNITQELAKAKEEAAQTWKDSWMAHVDLEETNNDPQVAKTNLKSVEGALEGAQRELVEVRKELRRSREETQKLESLIRDEREEGLRLNRELGKAQTKCQTLSDLLRSKIARSSARFDLWKKAEAERDQARKELKDDEQKIQTLLSKLEANNAQARTAPEDHTPESDLCKCLTNPERDDRADEILWHLQGSAELGLEARISPRTILTLVEEWKRLRGIGEAAQVYLQASRDFINTVEVQDQAQASAKG
jgi:chromosome segregation ATPase